MQKVVFEGYYGYMNSGDDSFMEVAAWGANRYWNVSKSVFLSETLPKIITHSRAIGKNAFPGHGFIKNILSISTADAFVSAGGSVFHSEINSSNIKKIFLLKKKIKKVKIGAIGVSIGPFKSKKAEKDNIELFKYFDFLALRDGLSYNMATSFNLPYQPVNAFDLAALLPKIYDYPKKSKERPQKIIGVSLCNYEEYINGNILNQNRRNVNVINLLKTIASIDPTITFRFFIFNGHPIFGDKLITQQAITLLKDCTSNIEIINYNDNVSTTWGNISTCSFVIAMRLHAAIFACFANVPFFLIEYHRKCTDFIKEIGLPDKFRMYDAHFDCKKVAYDIFNIIYDKEFIINSQEQLIEKAKLNFTEINIS